jgi:hypothetical protein
VTKTVSNKQLEGNKYMLKRILLSLVAFALLALPALAQSPTLDFMKEFPEAKTYVMNSEPFFNIAVGDQTEVLKCQAELKLRAGSPYVAEDGTRRVDIEVMDWHAAGTSKLLGGDVKFRMLQGVSTPDQSYVKSFQTWDASKPQDFPAHAQFAVPYELETPFGTVTGLFGLTEGTVRSFPPWGEIFTMKKGDTAELMAALMPEPISALSAAGEVTPVNVTVRPAACVHEEIQ